MGNQVCAVPIVHVIIVMSTSLEPLSQSPGLCFLQRRAMEVLKRIAQLAVIEMQPMEARTSMELRFPLTEFRSLVLNPLGERLVHAPNSLYHATLSVS